MAVAQATPETIAHTVYCNEQEGRVDLNLPTLNTNSCNNRCHDAGNLITIAIVSTSFLLLVETLLTYITDHDNQR